MASGEVAEIVNDAWPYVSAAVTGYGAAVLKTSEDAAANATLSLGRRILQRIFGQGQPPEVLSDLASEPQDTDLQAALRVALRKLLAEDDELLAQVRDMLPEDTAPRMGTSNIVKDTTVHGPVTQVGTVNGDFRQTISGDYRHAEIERVLPEESSLDNLRDEQIGEITGFLSGHIKTLLELLADEEGHGIDPFDQVYTMMTSLFNAPTGDRFQTPPCVSKPKILPEPDLVVARAHLQELRWFRNWGLSHAGNSNAADPSFRDKDYVEAGMLVRIDAARNLLNSIHSSNITFTGERALRFKKETGRNSGSVTNIDRIGVANFYPPRDDSIDPENLIIATVEIVPGPWCADLVVDSDPPYAITPSGSIYVITLETRSEQTVVLQKARPVIISRQTPRRVCQAIHITGVMDPRKFTTDLDAEKPQLNPEGVTFPFKISSTDPEQFWIQPTCRNYQVGWKLELDWICAGNRGTVVIGGPAGPAGSTGGPSGRPTGPGGLFEVYPEEISKSLFTKCDPSGHEKGCPTLKLKKSDPRAPRSTFSDVRDTSRECWLFASRALGMM